MEFSFLYAIPRTPALGIALGVLANLITGRTWERFEKPKA